MGHTATEIFSPDIDVVGDIAYVLGRPGNGDVDQLCQDVDGNGARVYKTNALAKYKPTNSPIIGKTGKPTGSTYWKGVPGVQEISGTVTIGTYTCSGRCVWITCCGVTYLGFTSPIDVLGAFNPIANPFLQGDSGLLNQNYRYSPPSYNSRPLDFDGYRSDAAYNVIPDYGTETGTKRVNVNNPEARKVKCGLMSQAGDWELTFDDLFKLAESGHGTFAVVTGVLNDTVFTLASISSSTTMNDDYFKELELDLGNANYYGKTIIAIYCAIVTYNNSTYYVPVMQSNGYKPNTTIPAYPNRKVYNSWYLDSSTPYYAMTMVQKQLYGTSNAFQSVQSMTMFATIGTMNRWYLKIGVPKKPTSGFVVNNNSFMIRFTGQFWTGDPTAPGSRLQLVYFDVLNPGARFVLKSSEPNTMDWGTTENVTITAGSGNEQVYLAIYDVFTDRNAVVTSYGGQIWRIEVFMKQPGQTDFPSEPDLVYGSLQDGSRLSIAVQNQHS